MWITRTRKVSKTRPVHAFKVFEKKADGSFRSPLYKTTDRLTLGKVYRCGKKESFQSTVGFHGFTEKEDANRFLIDGQALGANVTKKFVVCKIVVYGKVEFGPQFSLSMEKSVVLNSGLAGQYMKIVEEVSHTNIPAVSKLRSKRKSTRSSKTRKTKS